jgi:hypothetical protein
MRKLLIPALTLAALAAPLSAPLSAKDHLGIYSDWAAFRDKDAGRCYAIAKPAPSSANRDFKPYATIGTWPSRDIRGQVHFRLSRNLAKDARISLKIGKRTFALAGRSNNAWATSKAIDAQIVSAMRSAKQMVVRTRDDKGRRFSNTYDLTGAATAMDAATLGCADR